MTIKEELHRLVEVLEEEDASEALAYLSWLADKETEMLTEEEQLRVEVGEAQIERGEYVTLEELQRRLRG